MRPEIISGLSLACLQVSPWEEMYALDAATCHNADRSPQQPGWNAGCLAGSCALQRVRSSNASNGKRS